jgi:histidinol-phosphate aminotransferase
MSRVPCRAAPVVKPAVARRPDVGWPLRDVLRNYTRDTYVRRTPNCDSCDAPENFDGGIIDCATGIFEFDPSPRVARALGEFDVHRLDRYAPYKVELRLKRAILDRFRPAGVTEQQVFLGHGSFNLLERLIHKFLKPGMMAGVGPQFSEVPSEFGAAGGHYRSFRLLEPDGALPMIALEKALEGDAFSVLYIDNPNNPLGRSFEPGTLDRLAGICDRNGTALLIDEAFGDYLDDSASAIHLVPRYRNLIVVRSFSKALGLAGERIGYMFLSPELARAYREVDVPFEPGVVAQTLAIETLADPAWIERVRLEVRHAKSRIVGALAPTGMSVLPTHPDVAIMAVHRPGADLSCDFRRRGIVTLPGSNFANTHAAWDDSYCRLRVAHGDQLDLLCKRLATV